MDEKEENGLPVFKILTNKSCKDARTNAMIVRQNIHYIKMTVSSFSFNAIKFQFEDAAFDGKASANDTLYKFQQGKLMCSSSKHVQLTYAESRLKITRRYAKN